jgi:hypothetical protein
VATTDGTSYLQFLMYASDPQIYAIRAASNYVRETAEKLVADRQDIDVDDRNNRIQALHSGLWLRVRSAVFSVARSGCSEHNAVNAAYAVLTERVILEVLVDTFLAV